MLPYIYIFGKLVPLYGIFVVLGILTASAFVIANCRRKKLLWENALIIGVSGIGLGFFGAKITYMTITYTSAELISIILSGNISLILNGGFVFYGGLVFGIFGVVLGARIANTKISYYENILIQAIPIAHAFGRVGCLCAGCCYGKPTSFAFSVIYKNPLSDAPIGIPTIPIQFYEAIVNILIFSLLLILNKKIGNKKSLLPYYLMMYSASRFFLEFFRYDYVRGIVLGFSTSQIISMILFLSAMVLLEAGYGIKK